MKTTEFIDPLLPLVENLDVTEIIINDFKNIHYEIQGRFHKSDNTFDSLQTYKLFIQRLCHKSKIQFDLNTPCADGYLEPFRIHLITPPVSKDFHLTLRRIKSTPWSFPELIEKNWASSNMVDNLLKHFTPEKNMLIIGTTGSGKTSCMNALLQTIKPHERVITIEDTDELLIPNELSVKLLTRHDVNGYLKSYTQEDLIKQSLRMRPHRLVVGEVRGREARDLLLALSTGHTGSLCSLHAESAMQALIRLEMLIKMGAPEWDPHTVRRLIYFSVHYILTLGLVNQQRKLLHLHQVAGLENNGLTLTKIF